MAERRIRAPSLMFGRGRLSFEGEHIAPVYWPGLVRLQHNPRAMDIFSFLSAPPAAVAFGHP